VWLEIQREFRAAVMGVEGALAPHVNAASGPLSQRIGVYRNTVQQSLIDVLATAFPAVHRIVGGRFFSALAHDFVRGHLPDVPQLSVYGAKFPDFIATHERLSDLAYLADVARLEWARGEAYFADDAAPLDPAKLAAIAPENLAPVIFTLHPAARLIASPHPIYRIWTVNQPDVGDVPALDLTISEQVIITRPYFEVTVRLIAPADAAFVAALNRKLSLGEAVAEALSVDAAFNLQAALQDHFIHGTFAAIQAE
jgi:hypothetical protein